MAAAAGESFSSVIVVIAIAIERLVLSSSFASSSILLLPASKPQRGRDVVVVPARGRRQTASSARWFSCAPQLEETPAGMLFSAFELHTVGPFMPDGDWNDVLLQARRDGAASAPGRARAPAARAARRGFAVGQPS